MSLSSAAIAKITATFNPCTNSRLTVEEYIRHYGSAKHGWRGDVCGCTDDRCEGFHHSEGAQCLCLEVQLDDLHEKLTEDWRKRITG